MPRCARVGGRIVEGISWQWIFWLNVPIGIALIPLALARLGESRGPSSRLDLPGVGLASAGLLGVVWGLVRGNGQGWTSPEIVGSLLVGAVFLVGFVLWELRSRAPMLPMRFFRNRTFSLTQVSSLAMFFGMFGSIFLLVQFFISEQGYSPLQSGIRILPWTAMPLLFAPIAGALYDRIGGGRIIGVGLTLQAAGLAWIATVSSPTVPYSELIAPFFLAGTGMGLFFGAVPSLVLSSVRRQEEDRRPVLTTPSGNSGGVFGVAVLASIFASYGGYRTPETFSNGLNAAVYVGAAVVAVGALAAFAIGRREPRAAQVGAPVLEAGSMK